jgi:hypothetical protein
MKNSLLLLAGILLGLMISSCEYDNAETLYPPAPCDTTMVTYSLTIAPIISLNCLSPDCHGGTAQTSGIPMEGYDNLKVVVDNQRLIGALRWQNSYSFMPKNTTALVECDIEKIERWVLNGAPNN